ncbi:hypothetical protein D3C86_1653000 [compost metagenome]
MSVHIGIDIVKLRTQLYLSYIFQVQDFPVGVCTDNYIFILFRFIIPAFVGQYIF